MLANPHLGGAGGLGCGRGLSLIGPGDGGGGFAISDATCKLFTISTRIAKSIMDFKLSAAPITFDWSIVPIAKVQEVLRQSELYLNGQLTRIEQADQRSLGLLSVTVPSAVAAFGASISGLLSTSFPESVAVGGIVAACCLTLSGIYSVCALGTEPFFIAGNVPTHLLDKADMEQRPAVELLAEYAGFHQTGIETNATILARRSKNIGRAIKFFMASPVVGAGVITALVLFDAVKNTPPT